MTEPLFQYMNASRTPGAPLIAIEQDLPKKIVDRTGAFSVEYGVRGRELALLLRQNAEKFIHDMEMQGLTLVTGLRDPVTRKSIGNPQVVTHEDGTPYGTYSVHNDLDRAMPDEIVDAKTSGGGASTQQEPRSLEDSGGLVDYRIIGVFWAPQVTVEILTSREDRLAQEQATKNPTVWGGGSSIPNRPSIAR